MSTYQPFVGEHAEYYRRRILREAIKPDALVQENEYLRQRIYELEQELANCDEQLEYLLLSRRSIFQRILDWLA